jgi:transcriptional regulator with AAA-type ATPase domain
MRDDAAPVGGMKTLEHEGRTASPAGAAVPLGALLTRLVNADDPTAPSARYRLEGRSEVVVARSTSPGSRTEGRTLWMGLDDGYASSRHLRLDRAGEDWVARDEGSTNGTFVDGVRLEEGERRPLSDGALLEVGHTFYLFRDGACGLGDMPALLAPARRDGHEPITLNPEWELELAKVERLAPTLHPVLIEGESGAGKEVLARFLHERSGRVGPLVSVNCGALPENLLEDELFGHVRGAFSGAQSDRQGLVRAAHQGTLFLDEVGEMPTSLQVKLLRVLENHRVRPVGAEVEWDVDVRVVAATNRDLRGLVAQDRFRHDLLARLGLSIHVPAIRQRREDLGLLLRSILRLLPGGGARVRFDQVALRLLLLHAWPLNVRALRQAVLVAVDLAKGDGSGPMVIEPHHLPADLSAAPEAAEGGPAPTLTSEEQAQRDELAGRLASHGGNVAALARELGVARTNLQRLLSRLGVARPGARS